MRIIAASILEEGNMSKKRRDWQTIFSKTEDALNEWRASNPRATFNDIEDALDGELARLRAQMLRDLAEDSPQRAFRKNPQDKRPVCPDCGAPLQANGEQQRTVVTNFEQEVTLRREQGRCPHCGRSVFPPG